MRSGHPRPTRGTHYQARSYLGSLSCPHNSNSITPHLLNSALTERLNLKTDSSLYSHGFDKVKAFLIPREVESGILGRYAYGKLEYPYSAPSLGPSPDVTTKSNQFPPGRFHQDSFTGNSNIRAFYVQTLVPLLNSQTSFYYHLDNSTINDDAILSADANLLQLLSHR